jgi:hypothetical protein
MGMLKTLIIAGVSIAVYTMLWFVLYPATMGIINTMLGIYTFPSSALNTVNFLKLMWLYHPVFFWGAFGLWVYSTAARGQTAEDQAGVDYDWATG